METETKNLSEKRQYERPQMTVVGLQSTQMLAQSRSVTSNDPFTPGGNPLAP